MGEPTQRDVDVLLKLWELSIAERMQEAMAWMLSEFSAKDYTEFKEKYPRGSEGRRKFNLVCGNYELAGLLIARGLLNEDLYFDLIGGIEPLWGRVKGIMPGWRAESDPRMYENFEILHQHYLRWRESHPPKVTAR
ncbi:MAG: DUF4760 domain-containing protein [Chloroflexi bacterium]|nr:DUF4760 domain-containing protein [Chloroflexota bacterium]MCL5076281.1 DUF4760 domain-containing protein [Chloroflexota bacterium]